MYDYGSTDMHGFFPQSFDLNIFYPDRYLPITTIVYLHFRLFSRANCFRMYPHMSISQYAAVKCEHDFVQPPHLVMYKSTNF